MSIWGSESVASGVGCVRGVYDYGFCVVSFVPAEKWALDFFGMVQESACGAVSETCDVVTHDCDFVLSREGSDRYGPFPWTHALENGDAYRIPWATISWASVPALTSG